MLATDPRTTHLPLLRTITRKPGKPSPARLKAWFRLRSWERSNHELDAPNGAAPENCAALCTLRAEHDQGRLLPRLRVLPMIAGHTFRPMAMGVSRPPLRAGTKAPLLLAIVALACLGRRSRAVVGSLDEWATLLGVSRRSVAYAVQYLSRTGWLQVHYRYAPGGRTRTGDMLQHLQAANAYTPGPSLCRVWAAYCASVQSDAAWRARKARPVDNSRRRYGAAPSSPNTPSIHSQHTDTGAVRVQVPAPLVAGVAEASGPAVDQAVRNAFRTLPHADAERFAAFLGRVMAEPEPLTDGKRVRA